MRDRTLSERLMAEGQSLGSAPAASDRGALLESVLSNLQEILNCRAGCCETRRDFGMPDFNDVVSRFPDAVPAISRAIRTQIENFEPRLSGVNVRHLPDPDNPLGLAFHIAVTIDVGENSERMSFETLLGDDGKLQVRG